MCAPQRQIHRGICGKRYILGKEGCCSITVAFWISALIFGHDSIAGARLLLSRDSRYARLIRSHSFLPQPQVTPGQEHGWCMVPYWIVHLPCGMGLGCLPESYGSQGHREEGGSTPALIYVLLGFRPKRLLCTLRASRLVRVKVDFDFKTRAGVLGM